MKQRKIIQGKRIISLLIAMMLATTTILPAASVCFAQAEETEIAAGVPESEAAPEESEGTDEPENDTGASEEAPASEVPEETGEPDNDERSEEEASTPEEAGEPEAASDNGEAAPEETMTGEEDAPDGNSEEAAPAGGDSASENGDDQETEETEEAVSFETTFRVGDGELVVTLGGDYSDSELSLYVPEEAEEQKAALEKALGASAENFRIVMLRNAGSAPVMIGRDGAAKEDEIPVTVSGSWIDEDTDPVFALMNEDGTVQIVETQTGTLDDGTNCRRFGADLFSVLMICEKGEALPGEVPASEEEPSEEELPEEAQSEFSAQTRVDAPVLKAAPGDTMDVTVNIDWAGNEPVDKSSRPLVVYVTMERSADGTNWEKYAQDIPFAITSFADPAWTGKFTLPAADDSGNPYTYHITETNEGLGRYLVPKDPVTVSAQNTTASITNTYNDEWDYHLRMFWDVSDDAGKVLQDVHTKDRSMQEITYHVAVSTQKKYEACDDPMNPTKGITVRIPRKLFTDRNGQPVYPSAISVGTEDSYDDYYYFRYVIDEKTDEIVFYNWSELPGSYNIDMKVQYKLDPLQIEDCTLGELQAHGEGHYAYQPATDNGKQDSDPIYYRLDTGAEISLLKKEDGYPLREVPPSMVDYTFDFSNYHYMVYILRYRIDGNQPVKPIIFTDMPETKDGEDGKVVAILQPEETDTVTGSGGDEIHTYTRPATSGSTPSGTAVKFTELEDGGAEWQQEFDLLRKSENGNYATFGEQCYYLIVQYNALNENGYIIKEKIYHNKEVNASLEVSDPQHSADVREVNDLYDTDKKFQEGVEGPWEPEQDIPVGPGPYFAIKRMGDNGYPGLYPGYTRLKYGQYHVYSVTTRFDVDGEWLKENSAEHYYYADWYDDDVYMRGYYDDGTGAEWHEYQRLGAEDYQIWYTLTGSTYFDVTAYDIDPNTGQHIPEKGVFTIQVKKGSGPWIDYTTFTLDSTGHARITPEPSTLALKGYTGIRLKTPAGMTGKLYMTMNVWYIINGNSPVARELLDKKGATDLQIVNHSTNDLYTSKTENGPYRIGNPEKLESMPDGESEWVEATGVANYPGESDGIPAGYVHAYRSWGNTPKKVAQNTYILKSLLDQEDHQEAHYFSHQWAIAPVEYFNTYSIPREELQDMGFSADTAVFYDLLPPGYHLDETRPIEVSGSAGVTSTALNPQFPASVTEYTVTENFRDTGRDLVTFKVKSERATNDNLFISGYTYTGFTLHFWTNVSYFDVEEYDVRNLCMYQRGDKKAMVGDVSYSDMRGYGVDRNKYLVNGEIVMDDLDGDGKDQPKSAMYYSTPVHPTTTETQQDGLYKFVSGNSGLWRTEDQTDLNGIYHYQLILETAEKSTTSDVVLYDVLEDAANTGGATGEKEGWKGVLQDVDVNRAASRGIYPVVYYTTEKVSYNDGQPGGDAGDWDNSLVNRPEIWTTTKPADPSTITAIAVDLRWKDKDQTERYEFNGADIVGIDLTMLAPDKLQESPYAYNRPAFTSKIQVDGSPNPSQKFNISTRTRIELHDLQNFELFKYYEAVDASGKTVNKGLGGATFALYMQQCSKDHDHDYNVMPGTADSCWGEPVQTKVTSSDGMVSFNGLNDGTYAVIETAVPSMPVGLKKLDNRWWTFSVDVVKGQISAPEKHSTDERKYPSVDMKWDESTGTGCYTLKNEIPYFNISVEKSWKDEDGNECSVPYGDTLIFDLFIGDDTVPFRTAEYTIPSKGSNPFYMNNVFIMVPRINTEGEPIRYRLEERSNAGYVITEPKDGSVKFTAPEDIDLYTAYFTNTPSVGTLKISKKVSSGDASQAFTVTVKLEKDNKALSGEYPVTVTGASGKQLVMLFRDGTAEFEIHNGETWLISDLPLGTVYTVDERALPAGWKLETEASKLTGTIIYNQTASADLENSYTPSPAIVHFEGTKTLNGRELKDAEFSFTLTGSDGTKETVTNDGKGKIRFSDITYDEEGTYTYEVKEEASDKGGVVIDHRTYSFTVEVTDNGKGQLVAKAEGADIAALDFVNTYEPVPAKAHFEGIKTLNGRKLKDAEFSFTLSDADGKVIETVKNDGEGKIDFTEITYDKAGTYTYTVKEDATDEEGVTIDSKERPITVEVTDDGNGKLEAEVTGGEVEDLTFVNTYKPAPAKVHFEGIKTLNGRKLKDAEFSFTLSDADGKVIETVKNDGEGKIDFTEITYDEIGTYTYTVKEEATTAGGVTIDSKERPITVEVTDDGNGKLVAEVTGGEVEDLTFVNTYKPAPTKVHFEGIKTLTGRKLKDAEFSFTLSDADGKVIETVRNDGEGKIVFGDITYDKAGTYTYKVKETGEDKDGVVIDKTERTVTVKVTDDDGELKAEVTGGDAQTLKFVNTYKPTPAKVRFQGVKTLNGRRLKNAEFSFTLTGSDGTKETVTNDGNGRISFSEITYDKTGTYTYRVNEEATSEEGVTIDSTVYNITVRVTDDGKGNLKANVSGANATALNFTNTYKPGRPPKTGDDSPLMLYILLLGISGAAIAVWLRRRKTV